MNYFTLYPHCYYVRGRRNGAIYDILQKRVLWMEEPFQNRVLELSRQGASLAEMERSPQAASQNVRAFTQRLQDLDVGSLTREPKASVKFKPLVTPFSQNKSGIALPLGRVMLEISSRCPLDCAFCRPESRVASMECMCGRYSGTQRIAYDIPRPSNAYPICGPPCWI